MIPLLVAGLIVTWLVMALLFWMVLSLTTRYGAISLRLDEIAAAPRDEREVGPPGLSAGADAPPFELADLDGKTWSLADFRGKNVLLIFFHPQCGYCRRMATDLGRVRADGGDVPIPIVISAGEAEANLQLRDDYSVKTPWLLQTDSSIAEAYHIGGTPMGYVVDGDGHIVSDRTVGGPQLLSLLGIELAMSQQPNRAQRRARQRGNRSLDDSRIRRDGLPPGAEAPPFTLTRTDGGTLALDDYRGRKRLLVFVSPSCTPCEVLLPHLQRIADMKTGIQIILIGRGGPDQNRAKAEALNVTLPFAVQKRWEVSRDYGIFATPVAFLVDEAGTIAERVATGLDPIRELAVRAAEAELLAGSVEKKSSPAR